MAFSVFLHSWYIASTQNERDVVQKGALLPKNHEPTDQRAGLIGD